MARPVTLFTGQWADLPLEEIALRLRVVRLGDRPVDLEVVSPARELDAVEAPLLQLSGK